MKVVFSRVIRCNGIASAVMRCSGIVKHSTILLRYGVVWYGIGIVQDCIE